jgi:outer membrane protein assembly factor BamB
MKRRTDRLSRKIPFRTVGFRRRAKNPFFSLVFFIFALTFCAWGNQEKVDWPQFRGPNGCGVSGTRGLPLEFGPDKNVIWKIALPTGYSSPVLTDDVIFLTACEEETLLTLCLDRQNGKILWRKVAPRPRQEKIDPRNNPASPSPVTDGKQVYVFFPDFGLLAYDLEGNELWRLPQGPFNNLYGMGASPVLVDEKVILVCDQNTDSYIIAIDKYSGRQVWKTVRPEARSGHSTPVVYTPEGGRKHILVPGSFFLTAYEARTGEKIWWSGGLSVEMKSTPVVRDDVLFVNGYATPLNQPGSQVKIPAFDQALETFDKDSDKKLNEDELPERSPYDWLEFIDFSGDGALDADEWSYFEAALASLNGMLAMRLGGRGDMSESNVVWQYHRSVPQLPSPLLYKNVLYMLNDGGVVTTFKPESGEVITEGRIPRAGSHFYSSPVAADDKIFIISLRGIVSVIGPGGGLDLLAQNELRELCYATPAFAEGKIYLRTVDTLFCFGQKN